MERVPSLIALFVRFPSLPQAIVNAVCACHLLPRSKEELLALAKQHDWKVGECSDLHQTSTILVPKAWDGGANCDITFDGEHFRYFRVAIAIARGQFNLRQGWTAHAINVYGTRCIQWRCTKFQPMVSGVTVEMELYEVGDMFVLVLQHAWKKMIQVEKKYNADFAKWKSSQQT